MGAAVVGLEVEVGGWVVTGCVGVGGCVVGCVGGWVVGASVVGVVVGG